MLPLDDVEPLFHLECAVRFGATKGLVLLAALLPLACGGGDEPDIELGPADGRHLPAADTGRVAVGEAAPDFTLASYEGGTVALSGFRGQRDVVLVFYRGHW